MQYKLNEQDIRKLVKNLKYINKVEDLSDALEKDSRLLIAFRLSANIDRNKFSSILGKHTNTISNLERGNFQLSTKKKCYEYARLLLQKFTLPKQDEVIKGYKEWLLTDMENRATRAREIAYLGGKATAKKLSLKQRISRARKAGLAAKKFKAGLHAYPEKWMMWSKKGLKRAGRKTAIGPKGEKMSNELEALTAKTLIDADIDYKYESMLVINNKIFYPDFIVGDCIIECCYWGSVERWKYLSWKLNLINQAGYNCFVVTKQRCKKLTKFLQKTVSIFFEDNLKDCVHLLPNGWQPPCHQ